MKKPLIRILNFDNKKFTLSWFMVMLFLFIWGVGQVPNNSPFHWFLLVAIGFVVFAILDYCFLVFTHYDELVKNILDMNK